MRRSEAGSDQLLNLIMQNSHIVVEEVLIVMPATYRNYERT